jgi:hypothetical protein
MELSCFQQKRIVTQIFGIMPATTPRAESPTYFNPMARPWVKMMRDATRALKGQKRNLRIRKVTDVSFYVK